ncbi:MAG TPA: metal-sulfur cluster assembly factor [Longimicrobiales bacterium]|nr:metal-sulfur cluster assembly factor [Longimicrobiales bacterium]
MAAPSTPAPADVERRTLPVLDTGAGGSTRSGSRWHDAVRAASVRTKHELPEAMSSSDPRYRSDDEALDRLWRALREVADPELPVSLVDLGLVYGIRRDGTHVEVDLTFTATACPCMSFIKFDVEERLLREANVERVTIHEVWSPPWTVEKMTKEGRTLLRSFGVAA